MSIGKARIFASTKVGTALIFLFLAVLLRLPLAFDGIHLTPDAVEYVNVARHIVKGEGVTLSIKFHYFDSQPVVHSNLGERPILFPLLASLPLLLGGSIYSIQLMNVLFVGAIVALLFLITDSLFSRRVGIITGSVALFSPWLTFVSNIAWSDALSALLVLLMFLVILQPKFSSSLAFLGGLFCGLSYLTRPVNILALLVLLAVIVGRSLNWGERGFKLLLGVLGFLIPTSPVFAYNTIHFGWPFRSAQVFNFISLSFSDGMFYGYGKNFASSPFAFLIRNWQRILPRIGSNTLIYFKSLFLDSGGLFVFSLGIPAAIFLMAKKKLDGKALALFSLGVLNFIAYSLTWGTFGFEFDAGRFLLVSYLLLLPLGVVGLSAVGLDENTYLKFRQKSISVLVAIAFFVAGISYLPRTAALDLAALKNLFEHKKVSVGSDLEYLYNWINKNVKRSEIIGLSDPWPINFYTQRPVALLPYDLSRGQLIKWVREYRIDWVFLSSNDLKSEEPRGRYYEILEEIVPLEGQKKIGDYRVFDMRTLRLFP